MPQAAEDRASVAVDHVVAIKAGGTAYPPLDGLRSECTSCHNRKTMIVEQLGGELTVKGCDENGYPLDPNHPWYRAANDLAGFSRFQIS